MDQKSELQYLDKVKSEIKTQIAELKASVSEYGKEIVEQKRELWQNIYEMDPGEKAFNSQMIYEKVNRTVDKKNFLQRLEKMYLSPYFARVDFADEGDYDKYYIGLGHIEYKNDFDILVYDWRAPISSLFYDYEVGRAHYLAPDGQIEGEITGKYQYKIKNGQMEYMFDSSLTIHDEVLQKELSKNTSKKMRNIVATIQKEQNKIIRADKNYTLITQGVAGSGKTSIALHRVAFLLYKYKDTLKSSNILIVSPSKVFSNYISEVLPELGEENIFEISLEDIAIDELGTLYNFQRRFEHIDFVLNHSHTFTEDEIKSMRYKSSLEFVGHLKAYVIELTPKMFIAEDLTYKGHLVPKKRLEKLYHVKHAKREPGIRMQFILEYIYESIEAEKGIKLRKIDKKGIEKNFRQMFHFTNIMDLYKTMMSTLENKGHAATVRTRRPNYIEYEDIYPIILLKYYILGVPDYRFVKHLVIDEMQDYTPVQYEIINKLFSCSKTILGDIMQIVDPYTNIGGLNNLVRIYGENAMVMNLMTSYRSSIEITNFAQSVIGANEIRAVERHGHKPEIVKMPDVQNIYLSILEDIQFYKDNDYKSIAILCKTMAEAKEFYKNLENYLDLKLLIKQDDASFSGVIVTTSFIAKGLEFDCVIIPQIGIDNYFSTSDKQSLYVSCTRALHHIKMYYTGEVSPFISKAIKDDLVEVKQQPT